MRVRIILCALALCITLFLSAQSGKLKFQSSIATGLLGGEGAPAFQVQAINGVKYNLWSAGIGAGLDYYHTRSVPVFLDVRKTLSNRSKPAFVYVSGGYNIPWINKEDEFFILRSKGGLYFDGGIGFLVPVLKTQQLFFSAGWSAKKFSKTMNTMSYLSIWPRPKEAFRDYEYTVTNVSLKAGLRF
jgi:hypothetical protein